MTDLAGVLIGQAMPPIIDLTNRLVPNSKVRFLIALILCLLCGVFMNIKHLAFQNIDDILKSGVVVFTSAQIAYKMYYENSNVQQSIRATD